MKDLIYYINEGLQKTFQNDWEFYDNKIQLKQDNIKITYDSNLLIRLSYDATHDSWFNKDYDKHIIKKLSDIKPILNDVINSEDYFDDGTGEKEFALTLIFEDVEWWFNDERIGYGYGPGKNPQLCIVFNCVIKNNRYKNSKIYIEDVCFDTNFGFLMRQESGKAGIFNKYLTAIIEGYLYYGLYTIQNIIPNKYKLQYNLKYDNNDKTSLLTLIKRNFKKQIGWSK